MQADGIRHSALTGKQIKKSGSSGRFGSYAIKNAIMAGADAFLTADLKYHQFYEKPPLADIGHFESERTYKMLIIFGKNP
jgi:putative NIF3 family GTP cyclohydrolase 1 type 2